MKAPHEPGCRWPGVPTERCLICAVIREVRDNAVRDMRDRIDELHQPVEYDGSGPYCSECVDSKQGLDPWPCRTRKAVGLDG